MFGAETQRVYDILTDMKLIFIRHGQTNYNVKDWCNSRPNPKVRLTHLGRQQVKAAAEKLKHEKIEVVFTSQLIRSQQTGLILNGYHHVPTIVDGRLNDRATGFEDKPAGLFYAWRDKQKNPLTCRHRGGESYKDMKQRFVSFIKDLKKTKYKTVLIVAHLPILNVARGYFKKISDREADSWHERQVPNCKIMRFTLKTKTSKKQTYARS